MTKTEKEHESGVYGSDSYFFLNCILSSSVDTICSILFYSCGISPEG